MIGETDLKRRARSFSTVVGSITCTVVLALSMPAHAFPFWSGLTAISAPQCSPSTECLVAQFGLRDIARFRPSDAFLMIERGIEPKGETPERLLALAELADCASGKFTGEKAISWSRDAAVYAVFCLEFARADDSGAIVRAARDVHNRAVRRCFHLLKTSESGWATRFALAGMNLVSDVPAWSRLGFETLEPAKAYSCEARALGRRDGLGVPLIAHRTLADTELDSWKHYGPREVAFAATAVIRPRGSLATWRDNGGEVLLCNPLRNESISIGQKWVVLAFDLNSPLEHRFRQPLVRGYEALGIFDQKSYFDNAGVFAVDPYVAGKVPVVLVHGLWSGPRVWMPMLIALRDDPILRARCQFWVVLYPSGYLVPVAARVLKHSLREIRQAFDPRGADPALDQVVVLGKSTGGQVVRILAEQSGDSIWNSVFTRPLSQIVVNEPAWNELASTFYFEPEPYIRRVIFVATAHRGGNLARQPGIQLGLRLIRRNNPLGGLWEQLAESNSEFVFQTEYRNRIPSSLDGLQAENPLLTALDSRPISPAIPYHSIIANIRRSTSPDKMTDGFVKYASAHLDGAQSERIVSSTHLCEANPDVISEVRRILHTHLEETTPESLTPHQTVTVAP